MSLGSLLWWCLMLHVCLVVSLMCVILSVKLISFRKGLHLLMDCSFSFFNGWLFRVVCSLLAQSWWRVWKRRWISMNIFTCSMALTWVFFPPDSLHGSTFEPRLSIPYELLILCLCCCFSGGEGWFLANFPSTRHSGLNCGWFVHHQPALQNGPESAETYCDLI